MARNSVKKPLVKRWWFWGIIVLTLIGLLTPKDPDKDTATPAPSETTIEQLDNISIESEKSEDKPQEDASEESDDDDIWIKAGMYKVGEEIPAGEYYIETTKGSSYFERTSDSTGSFESIIENDNISTFSFVTLEDGEYFDINNAKFTLSSNIDPITSKGEGMYRVGIDLPAGEYKIKALDDDIMGYCAVLSSSHGGGFANIISNDNFEGEKYITVADGQYLQLRGAEIL